MSTIHSLNDSYIHQLNIIKTEFPRYSREKPFLVFSCHLTANIQFMSKWESSRFVSQHSHFYHLCSVHYDHCPGQIQMTRVNFTPSSNPFLTTQPECIIFLHGSYILLSLKFPTKSKSFPWPQGYIWASPSLGSFFPPVHCVGAPVTLVDLEYVDLSSLWTHLNHTAFLMLTLSKVGLPIWAHILLPSMIPTLGEKKKRTGVTSKDVFLNFTRTQNLYQKYNLVTHLPYVHCEVSTPNEVIPHTITHTCVCKHPFPDYVASLGLSVSSTLFYPCVQLKFYFLHEILGHPSGLP